ncbi:MAG: phage holin family protein [Promethearchaeota archaeon]
MVTENQEEPMVAPLLVRLVAGIDYLIMFGVALVGGLVANFGLVANELLAELYAINPVAYAELILVLLNLNIPPPLFGTIMTAVGLTFAFVGLLGMIVAIGTAYRKSWAVPLGVFISVISIIGSVLAYFFGGPILPFLTGSLVIFAIVLQLLVVILMVNVFFTGAFLLWQLNELGGSYTQLGRFVLIWNLDMLCLIFTDLIVPGIDIIPATFLTYFGVAYIVVVIISFLNLIVRPIFTRIITLMARLSLGFAVSFILILLLNAGILLLIPLFISDFLVIGLPSALLGSLVLSITNTIFISIIGLDDDASFFQNYVRQQLLAEAEAKAVPKTKGLLVIEIDGLSHEAVRKALRRGYMPAVQKLIRSRSHKLIKWDCGIPSMTSSCQAGIMYGNNKDIPAFRWYRKREGRMVVSNSPSDAKFIDQSHSSGKGLLRGGSSVGNLISGDASYSFFTMSTLTVQDSEAGKRRSENLYYYLVKPYVFMRSLIYTLWDVFVELGQIFKQWLVRRKPRMGRLHGGYPIVRATANVFMRDIATAMVCQNLLRGLPSIYVTFLGYDEIAHHSGPLTTDALKSLQGIDKQIRRFLKIIDQYAPRPYEVILLADHGQSVGWTFKQRYDKSLKDTIGDLLEGKAQVGEVEALDAHRGYVDALVTDLNEGRRRVGAKGGRDRLIRGSSKFLEKQARKGYKEPVAGMKDDDVIVCASGNLAQIYFTFKKGKVTLQDLEARFPGFVANLVAHKGVGFAIVWDKEKGPVLLGKRGAVLLQSGRIRGSNPLYRYSRPKVRVKQLRRLAEFPSSGAIILISPIYQDGSVAAYEELVGSHGGLGGPQTEPFLLHPANVKVNGDNIINSEQIFQILNRRRPKK